MRTFSALSFAVGLFALAAPAHAQPPTSWLPLASYVNDAAHESQANRLRAALDACGIRSVTTCSVGCTLSVDGARWGEGRALFREVVAREHLDLSDAVMVTS